MKVTSRHSSVNSIYDSLGLLFGILRARACPAVVYSWHI